MDAFGSKLDKADILLVMITSCIEEENPSRLCKGVSKPQTFPTIAGHIERRGFCEAGQSRLSSQQWTLAALGGGDPSILIEGGSEPETFPTIFRPRWKCTDLRGWTGLFIHLAI